MNPYFITQIDWNDNGVYTDTSEDVSALVRGTPGISISRGNDQLQDLSPPMAGQHSFDLDNQAKVFSPENTGSPIYSYLHPGHLARVKIDDWLISINYTVAVAGNQMVIRPTIVAPTAYAITTGDFLVYDILWTSPTDYVALDLYNGSQYIFYQLGTFTDQNNLNASPITNIGSKAYYQFYTRQIDLSPQVGQVIYPVITGLDISNTIKSTSSQIQNAYIVNGNTVKFNICRAFETMPFTTISAINSTITGTDIANHYYLGYGYVDDLKQNSNPENQSVTIPSLGMLSRLKGQSLTTDIYTNIDTGAALQVLLVTAGFSGGQFNIDTGSTILDWWWLSNQDAFQAATDLLNSEGPGAKLFDSSDGKIVFHSRSRRLTNTLSTVSNGNFVDTGTPPAIIRPYKYDPGLKDIINTATTTVVTRVKAGAVSVVWTYGGTITLAPNQSVQINASTSDPFDNGLIPVLSTDYTLVSGGLTFLGLLRQSGQVIQINITANSSGAVITGLQFRAKTIPITSTNLISQTLDTSASQSKFGTKSFNDSIRQEISVNSAQDLINGIVTIYQNPRPTISITIINNDLAVYSQQLNREISDRISINEPQSAFNGDVWIEYVNHQIQKSGQSFVTQYGTEKVWSNAFAIWDSALWGVGTFGF
jgi:hypothetical protein